MYSKSRKSISDIVRSIPKWIGICFDKLAQVLRKVWYVILLSISTTYVICNFEEIVDFQFFTQFNGKNLIFVVWIVLLIIPLFDSFEGFGISIKRYNNQKEDKKLNDLVKNATLPSQEDLERKLKDESK